MTDPGPISSCSNPQFPCCNSHFTIQNSHFGGSRPHFLLLQSTFPMLAFRFHISQFAFGGSQTHFLLLQSSFPMLNEALLVLASNMFSAGQSAGDVACSLAPGQSAWILQHNTSGRNKSLHLTIHQSLWWAQAVKLSFRDCNDRIHRAFADPENANQPEHPPFLQVPHRNLSFIAHTGPNHGEVSVQSQRTPLLTGTAVQLTTVSRSHKATHLTPVSPSHKTTHLITVSPSHEASRLTTVSLSHEACHATD